VQCSEVESPCHTKGYIEWRSTYCRKVRTYRLYNLLGSQKLSSFQKSEAGFDISQGMQCTVSAVHICSESLAEEEDNKGVF
jgi:desulfoferrodoxin (superoxide reductase-like protein)